jgi:hypothetical protein
MVFKYDCRAIDWLDKRGLPHPPARRGNRLPTFDEFEQAAEVLGIGPDAPLLVEGIEDCGPDDCFCIRGDLVLELRLLRELSKQCGQLWVYPDCGSPAIIVDAALLPEEVAAAWEASLAFDDSWGTFHEQVYRA